MDTVSGDLLKHEKKVAKRAAKDLFYPKVVLDLIDKAQTPTEIARIMKSARKGEYDDAESAT